MPRELTVEEMAQVIHESQREAVAAGNVLVKTKAPAVFVEWDQLPAHVKAGRRKAAGHILARYQVTAREE